MSRVSEPIAERLVSGVVGDRNKLRRASSVLLAEGASAERRAFAEALVRALRSDPDLRPEPPLELREGLIASVADGSEQRELLEKRL